MQYLTIEQAQQTEGLKLVLTAGVPGPWSEFAKYMFSYHQLDYIAVAQKGGGRNPELVEWTRHRNAPIALYKDEAPRVRWLEILQLAERLGSAPSLLPADIELRMQMVGLCNEIAGEAGLAWNARLLMLAASVEAHGKDIVNKNPMFADYQYDAAVTDKAKAQLRIFLDYFAALIHKQRQAGSAYLIGPQLSAADLCWAAFSNMLQSLPDELNPMPESLRQSWGVLARSIDGYDAVLIEQRDYIYAEHLTLPLSF